MTTAFPGDVVVLGHNGFVGRALCTHLDALEARAHGFSSSTLDLRQPSALKALDPILNKDTTLILASALTPDRGATLDTLSQNFVMMANLGQYLEQHPYRKCVYLSSDAVYPMIEEPVTEASGVEPSGLYPLAKYTGERIIAHAAERSGAACLLLRLTAVFGPGDTHNSYGPNRFVKTAVADRSVRIFGQGEELRDHLYIDDAGEIIARLSASDAVGIVNVATGESLSFGAVVDRLQDLAPFGFDVVNAPRQGPVTHRQFDTRVLNSALPDLRFTPFVEGLKRTLQAAMVPAG